MPRTACVDAIPLKQKPSSRRPGAARSSGAAGVGAQLSARRGVGGVGVVGLCGCRAMLGTPGTLPALARLVAPRPSAAARGAVAPIGSLARAAASFDPAERSR